MIRTTLGEIRSFIETLSSEDGAYFLACARYVNQPISAGQSRFEARASSVRVVGNEDDRQDRLRLTRDTTLDELTATNSEG